MLKKLKLKFILINMALVGVIMLIVFGTATYLTARSETAEVAEHLNAALQLHMRQPAPDRGDPLNDKNVPPVMEQNEDINRQLPIKIVAVSVSESGEISELREYGMSMDAEELEKAVAYAMSASDNGHSELSLDRERGLLYVKREAMEKNVISFTSSEPLFGRIRSVTFIYSGCLLMSLVLFLFVSYLLSVIAIRPVERAWNQQKQFVADASHDLKTPLTVILANSDILRAHKEETVASQLQWVESTAEVAGRMRGLCEELLELAGSEDTVTRVEPCEVGLSELCQSICLQLEPVAFEKGVGIVSEIPDGISLHTDSGCCVRIMNVLLDNAIKYAKNGTEVYFRLTKTRQGAAMSFTNFGAVIPKEELPHIFERFYRADKARAVGGHGLGLSIAKNLTESIDGKISVSSSEKEGTTFTVHLRNI